MGCSLTTVSYSPNCTRIGSYLFYNTYYSGNAYIPAQIPPINSYAFENTKITSVEFEPSNAAISYGRSPFEGCTKLTTVTNIRDTDTYIATYLPFAETNINTVSFCEGATYGGNNLFKGLTTLKNVTFSSTMSKLKSNMFNGCTGLTGKFSLKGTNITEIYNNCFYGCTGITEFEFDDKKPVIIRDYCFAKCTGLAKLSNIPSISWSINNSIDTYGYKYTPFVGCSALTDLEFSDNCTSIGDYVFASYDTSPHHITNITGWDNVETIGSYAFQGNKYITSLILPEKLVTLKDRAFRHNSNLENVTFNDNLEFIGNRAFSGGDKISEIDLSKTKLKTIDEYGLGFIGAKIIKLPNTVTSIGTRAFYINDGTIDDVTYGSDNPLPTQIITDSKYVKSYVFSSDNRAVASTYTVKVPVSLDLTYNEKTGKHEGSFNIEVSGDMYENKTLTVKPSLNTITFTNQISGETTTGTIDYATNNKFVVYSADKSNPEIDTTAQTLNGKVSVELNEPGKWKGSLGINFSTGTN